jgi:outer membrane protein assembly factor BamB
VNGRRLTVAATVLVALGLAAIVPAVWLASGAKPPPRSSASTTAPRSRTTSTTSPTPTTTSTTAAPSASVPLSSENWTVYHGNPSGTGIAPGKGTFRTATHAWTSPALDGQLYGEPLVDGGRVFVATENDTVYALDAGTGAVVWSAHLALPVPAGDLPCGDISPTVGITGTPVIDPSRNEIFVVADELVDGTPTHRLVGLALSSGKVLVDVDVDPPGSYTPALLQRTGLDLAGDEVVFGFGGNDGDCSTYHGWVTAVPVTGHGPVHRFEIDPGSGERQGAVWMGGAAPEVTPAGDIWAGVGNGSVQSATGPFDDSDSVIELSNELALLQYFAPSDWYADNASDRDLGSTAPALLADGDVVQVGKSQTAYLLRRTALGGIGGQLASARVCDGADADGGDAVTGTVVYVPCRSGVEAVQTAGGSLKVLWRAAPFEPPIVAGGLVWAEGSGSLYGVSPSTGEAVATFPIGSNANHFPTPSVGDGLLLATGGSDGDQVVAFRRGG